MAAGQFAIKPGPCFASSNEFRITIRGKGAHAAMPHNGIDPVPVACQMVQAFQTIITRNKRPIDAGVISVTMIHTGEATNVVPDSCEIQGTVRTFTLEVLDLIESRMKAVAEHTCAAFGTECEFEFVRNYPPTINHPAETEFVRRVLGEMVGADTDMIAPDIRDALAAAGMALRPNATETSGLHGAIWRDGRWDGGADPRREGVALSEIR